MRRALLLILALAGLPFALPAQATSSSSQGSPVSCDSICQLARNSPHHAGAIVSGERIKLTASSQGNFNSATPTPSNACKFFDGAGTVGGMPCSGIGASPWSSNAAAFNGVYGGNQLESMLPYSNGAINSDTGKVCWNGGGHVSSLDSGLYCLDVEAAAYSRLTGGSGGNWYLAFPGGRYVTYSTAGMAPSWSYQTNSNKSGLWIVTNISGQYQVPSCHTYEAFVQVTGTNEWIYGGGFCNDGTGNIATGYNANLIVDDVAQTSKFVGASIGQYTGLYGRVVYDDASGKLYSWASGVKTAANFYRITSPAASPSSAKITPPGLPILSNYFAYGNDVVMPDPVTPTKRDYVAWNSYGQSGPQFYVVTDINGTPVYAGSAIFPNYGSSPATRGSGPTLCADPDNPGVVYYQDGSGLMPRARLVPSNMSASTYVADPAKETGDVPALYRTSQPALFFQVCKVLPLKRPGGGRIAGLFIMTAGGEVYLGKI